MSGNATTFGWQETVDEELVCADAARLLDVSGETLTQWARQFEFPSNVGDEPLPRFRRREIEALCATLPSAHSVEGAILGARRKLGR